jgi:hypothetical protein
VAARLRVAREAIVHRHQHEAVLGETRPERDQRELGPAPAADAGRGEGGPHPAGERALQPERRETLEEGAHRGLHAAHVDAAAEHQRIGSEHLLRSGVGRLHQLHLRTRLARPVRDRLRHAPRAAGLGGDHDEDPHGRDITAGSAPRSRPTHF